MSIWSETSFIDYLRAVDRLLEEHYGITTMDCGLEHVATAQEAGDTPEQCVLWIANKYDLDPVNITHLPGIDMRRQRIREQNDKFRRRCGVPQFEPTLKGTFFFTSGIMSLSPVQQIEIWMCVRNFNDFTENSDPYGEHDFGAFTLEGIGKVFWKIDYYDHDQIHGSKDPSDPEKRFAF